MTAARLGIAGTNAPARFLLPGVVIGRRPKRPRRRRDGSRALPGLGFVAFAIASYGRPRTRMRSQGSAAQRLTPRPHPRSLSPPTRTHRAGLALAERVRASKQWRDDDHADVCPDVGAALKASTCAEKARLSFRARSIDAGRAGRHRRFGISACCPPASTGASGSSATPSHAVALADGRSLPKSKRSGHQVAFGRLLGATNAAATSPDHALLDYASSGHESAAAAS